MIALTLGDPAGIGPEIARVLQEETEVVAYGHPAFASGWKQFVAVDGHLPEPGRPTLAGGEIALNSVDRALQDLQSGKVQALVTCPVAKQWIPRPGFTGHTEYLQEWAQVPEVGMLLVVEPFRVLHLTTHLSLREALDQVTAPHLLAKIRQGDQALRELGFARRRIGVLGLNPHAGEGGQFGREEQEVLGPAIREAQGLGLDVRGPLSPDAALLQMREGVFDLAIALYHDQGHVPLKLMGWGVNATVGLPYVRTSPAHGTAFDLAGTGQASPEGLLKAYQFALDWMRRRHASLAAR